MVALYALTMFVSATLLFIVQPMVAKLLLPSLGGSSAVWTTCMLFFQAMLLAGYGYSHLGARYLTPRKQVIIHLPLMLIAAVLLPFGIPDLAIDASESPTMWLLAALLISVGLPFLVVSTTAPLLQHFFAHVDHADSEDPYFLYGASNLGSMVALIGYPVVVEPLLGVTAQTHAWAGVYGLFVLLLAACAKTVFGQNETRAQTTSEDDAPPLTWKQRGRWIVLAAVPSSLMLGVTHHITTDIAAVPLLWVLPLALYLATFVLVFARKPVLLPDKARTLLPIMLAVIFAAAKQIGGAPSIGLHLLNFFLFTLFFHGTLARERPHVARLTEYFLLLSIGGAIGGLFNALLAPVVFERAIEFHLVMYGSIAFIAVDQWRLSEPVNRWVMPAIVSFACCYYLYAFYIITPGDWELFPAFFAIVLIGGAYKPKWQNVIIAIILTLGAWVKFSTTGLLTYDRSFFAAYKVYEEDREGGKRYRFFAHGNTVHGSQATDPEGAKIARSYHHPEGPIGQVLDVVPHESVLVIGLGAGAVASYAKPGTTFEFYEIDPLVYDIADEYFTYLSTCGDKCTVAIGDGRRLLVESGKKFDVIVLDAYNSDGMPTHLLTREVLQIYLEHLNENGVLLFHVSNRYLDVPSVVGTLCEDANVPAYMQTFSPSPPERARAELIHWSQFIVAAPDAADLAPFAAKPDIWKTPPTADVVWTDDYTNVLSVVRW